jgi:hypothetical protein
MADNQYYDNSPHEEAVDDAGQLYSDDESVYSVPDEEKTPIVVLVGFLGEYKNACMHDYKLD